jgi:hypothetical protein
MTTKQETYQALEHSIFLMSLALNEDFKDRHNLECAKEYVKRCIRSKIKHIRVLKKLSMEAYFS